jgi:hypothetical protein
MVREAGQADEHSPASGNDWTLVRIDIRATATPGGWPLARVELRHASRGRVTDIASCEGHLDSLFMAIGRIVGVDATVRSLNVQYGAKDQASATIEAEVAGKVYRGTGVSGDVLRSCALAYLDALSLAERDR